MSSHREAPEISQDPVADSTDVYAFRSPDAPDTVTLIANYIPLESPAGGPNFYEFGDDVLYKIHVSHSGHARADVVYTFRFRTEVRARGSFLYNTGQITSLDDPNFNRRQFYSLTRTDAKGSVVLSRKLASPPVNIGPRSTPDYADLAAQAVHSLPGGRKVFAGQRADAFFVDLGAIFDLAALRPFQNLHLISTPASDGVNTLRNSNVHSLALQVPITDLTGGYAGGDVLSPRSVIGVWTTASRQKSRVFDQRTGAFVGHGPWAQVSRLANPLVNEVLIPMGLKDRWNAQSPVNDKAFLRYVARPELANLLPVLYPDVFPNLASITADRADLVAILLTGLPQGVVPGFQNTTGPTLADKLRLNVSVPPTNPGSANQYGIIGGDLAGFPNGRRLADDVVGIELRAIAGATYPLVSPGYTPDAAAAALEDGTEGPNPLGSFPYMPVPYDGYSVPAA